MKTRADFSGGRKKSSPPLACLGIALCSACMQAPDLEMPATSRTEELGRYVVAGDELILSGRPGVFRYCIGDSLHEEFRSGTDTIGFLLRGDSLTIFLDPQFTDNGSRVQNSRLLLRVTGSAGLIGSWRYSDPGYWVISGTPTAAESTLLNDGLDRSRRELPFLDVTWDISPESITVFEDVRWAHLFLARWNGDIGGGSGFADSAVFDVSTRATAKLTVELTGRRTGEVVWITGWPNGDRTYRSGAAGHAEFRYFSSPLGCPTPQEPSWYLDFLTGNRKVVNIPPL